VLLTSGVSLEPLLYAAGKGGTRSDQTGLGLLLSQNLSQMHSRSYTRDPFSSKATLSDGFFPSKQTKMLNCLVSRQIQAAGLTDLEHRQEGNILAQVEVLELQLFLGYTSKPALHDHKIFQSTPAWSREYAWWGLDFEKLHLDVCGLCSKKSRSLT
jgi:hypothetical protein